MIFQMHQPLRIGVTGGIGSGKSIVCKIFAVLGIPIYDADARARAVMVDDKVLVGQIQNQFGEASYRADGSLNREYLSREVFNDPVKLEQLNALVHPRVANDSEVWMQENRDSYYLVKEAALLFEAGSYKQLDKIIVVIAPESLRVQRVLNRDRLRTHEEVIKIIKSQMSEAEKISRADFVIHNDESQLIVPQVVELHERFIAFAKNGTPTEGLR